MIFKKIDSMEDVGVICHYFQIVISIASQEEIYAASIIIAVSFNPVTGQDIRVNEPARIFCRVSRSQIDRY